MDGIVRLFCGCCGLGADQDTPYSQLHNRDSVTPIRDPPIQQRSNNGAHLQSYGGAQNHQHHQLPNEPLQQQGFVNPVHELAMDAPDGHNYNSSNSASPPLEDDENPEVTVAREKEELDNIVESTQQSIIAIGQTDVEGVIMMDCQYREAAYKQKTLKMTVNPPVAHSHEQHMYDFVFEPTQTPIQVPLRYDEMSATIDPSPIERMPFSCPDFNQLRVARTMGARNPQFLAEHPDMKAAGRTPSISQASKAKVHEAVDLVHAGIVGIEVQPRDLIVSMDF